MTVPAPQMIDPARQGSLGELLEEACLTFKTETALIEVARKKERHRLTYLDFARQAMDVAAWLDGQGVGPDDRVAILMSNQSRWLLSAYAVFHRGAVLVPLDFKLGPAEQLALLTHSGAKAVVTEHGLLRRIEKLEGALEKLPVALVSEAPPDTLPRPSDARFEELEAPAAPLARAPRSRDDLACVVYSSGTGGRAKGCMLTHDAYLEQLRGLMARFPMRVGHRTFSILPTNHAIDFMVGFLGPFSCGATVIHQRTLRPEFLASTMRAYGVTHMALVPLVLEAFEQTIKERLESRPRWARRMVSVLSGLNEMLTVDRPRASVSRALLGPVHEAFGGELEVLFCGGAFVDRARAELFYRLGLPVVIGYGLTEACTVATVNDLRPFRGDSVGRPVEGVELRVNDPGPDGVGEVWLRGRTLMRGYLDDPELTAEVITEDGWLRTGDLGWVDAAHHLHLVGRQKNMIVTAGGKNVYPEDIEGAFDDVPVAELVVYASQYVWPRAGADDPTLDDEELIAVVRRRRGDDESTPSTEEVIDALSAKNRRLPDFKRVKRVLFVEEEFPRTASMKVKRALLAETLRDEQRPERARAL